jgi:ankyrin repeat protein
MNTRIVSMACLLTALIWIPGTRAQQSGNVASNAQSFFDAIKRGDSVSVLELLRKDPTLIKATTKTGVTPVLYAVYAGRPGIAESLIARAVELNIFEAAATGRIDRVRELLKKDPGQVRAFSPDGWTALHLNFNNLDMAKLLIDAGANLDVNSRNKLNATPLQGAAVGNWIDLARLYLSKGANVNCRSEQGGTPLHEAAGNGFLDFARLLTDYKADVNAKDDNGKTPLTIALESKQLETAAFLREHGGLQ